MSNSDDDRIWEGDGEAATDVRLRRGSGAFARQGSVIELVEALARARNGAEAASLRDALHALDTDIEPWLGVIEALRERAEAFDAQCKLAGSDELTGIANRRTFNEVLAREVSRCRRSNRPLSLLLLDLDRLKEINDTHGHLAGDAAIIAISRACRASLRGSDLVARIGGDEFAVVLPETDEEQSQVVRRRIRRKLAMAPGGHATLGVSIGGSVMVEPDMDARTLIANADDALYRDKRARRDAAPAPD